MDTERGRQNPLPVVINFDKLAEIGIKGVRRAAVFMGLGLNAAHDPTFKNYQLSTVQNIRPAMIRMELIPANVNDKTLNHFKEEFGVWIIANGLREVIERFAVFLDGVNTVCQHIACTKQKLSPEVAEQRDRRFRQKGIEYKLTKLKRRFDVKLNHAEYISSINRARNCLTHRLGKVGAEDCRGGRVLEVKWLGMDLQFAEESGQVIKLNQTKDIVLRGPGTIQMKMVERRKSFSLGTFVRFEMYELAKICNFILNSVQAVTSSAIEYAKSMGIELVTDKELVT